MAETKMNVTLLAHTQISKRFGDYLDGGDPFLGPHSQFDMVNGNTDGQYIALSAIRTCYSPGKPSEIVAKEGAKYFGNRATDGEAGTEADRLFRTIVASKHTSTLEGITFNFAIEGVSRALLAQLTRHRVGFSFSVQSQRYVKFGSGDRSGGFDYVVPESIAEHVYGEGTQFEVPAQEIFESAMRKAQEAYDMLRKAGVPAEDARAVLPNAAATNLVMTANLRALLDLYAKRKPGNGAQAEISELATRLKDEVVAVEPWTAQFFEGA